jgi:hypothetical protein
MLQNLHNATPTVDAHTVTGMKKGGGIAAADDGGDA